MNTLLKYDNGERFLTISEFSDLSGCSKEELFAFIESGDLFPLVPTRQRILIRRIPSLLTEYLFRFIPDDNRYDECVNKPDIYLGHSEYVKNFDYFIKINKLKSDGSEYYISDKYRPMLSDIQYTNGEYIYIGKEVVKELSNFSVAYIKKFVSSRITRGFYYPDSHSDIDKLYDRLKFTQNYASDANIFSKIYSDNNSENYDPVSISSRFSFVFKNIYNKNPSLCYPDFSYSFDYMSILDDPLPITLWAAAHYLNLPRNDLLMGHVKHSFSWFEAYRQTDSNLMVNFFNAITYEEKYLAFFNLVKASSYFDQWIPLYPERNELTCTYDSLRFSSNQIEYAKSLKSKNCKINVITDNSRRDHVNYNHCIQRAFIYQLMQYVKKNKRDKSSSAALNDVIESCIQKAQDQLQNDRNFQIVAKSCSGTISTENFFNILTNIDIRACSGLFVRTSKKNNTQKSLDNNNASSDLPVPSEDSKNPKLDISGVTSSSSFSDLFKTNKSDS